MQQETKQKDNTGLKSTMANNTTGFSYRLMTTFKYDYKIKNGGIHINYNAVVNISSIEKNI